MNIEEQIQKAVKEGKFSNLPGQGQPLRLDDNPFEDPTWRSAYRILRNAGYSLPWIETARAIDDDLEQTRTRLQTAWRSYQSRQTQPASAAAIALERWQQAQDNFKEEILAINRRLLSYNLEVPALQFQRRLLDSEQELQALTSGPQPANR